MKSFGWFIAIVFVAAVFSNQSNVNRLGSNTVDTGQTANEFFRGVNNTLTLPQDDPRSKTFLRSMIVLTFFAYVFGAFDKKKEKG